MSVDASPDARILVFNFALALVAGLVFGSVRLRKAIVVVQVALSLLLLVGAGLFVRSLNNLLAQDPGFQPTNLVSFNLEPSLNGYESDKTKHLASTLIEPSHCDARGDGGRRVGPAHPRRRIVEQHDVARWPRRQAW